MFQLFTPRSGSTADIEAKAAKDRDKIEEMGN